MDIDLSATMEDYLETVHKLQQGGGAVRVKDIAQALEVKMPSVTSALNTLRESDLVYHEKYGDVELTESGRQLAEQVHRRHVTLSKFLTDILQLSPEEAEEEACRLEHGLSRSTLHRLMCLLDFIEQCPRSGADWLAHMRRRWENQDCDQSCRECIENIAIPEAAPCQSSGDPDNMTTLNLQEPGFRGTIVKLGGRGRIRRRLAEMGLTKGTTVEVERLAPLGDPLEIEVRGYHLSLRKDEAANVYVLPE